jgi:hypothetical protein
MAMPADKTLPEITSMIRRAASNEGSGDNEVEVLAFALFQLQRIATATERLAAVSGPQELIAMERRT